jgi:hypothetical protein
MSLPMPRELVTASEFYKTSKLRLADLYSLPAFDEVIDPQKDDRADQRHDEASGFAILIVANEPPQKRSQEGTSDSDNHRDQNASGVFAGHDELRKRTDDKTDKGSPQQAEHRTSSSVDGVAGESQGQSGGADQHTPNRQQIENGKSR